MAKINESPGMSETYVNKINNRHRRSSPRNPHNKEAVRKQAIFLATEMAIIMPLVIWGIHMLRDN